MGEDSSTRRPTRETMRSMICMRCWIVFEGQAGEFKFAGALDVDPVEAVDQNVGDGVVLEQRFERTEAEDFVEDFAGEAFAFGEAERNGFVVDGVADEDEDFFAGGVAVGAAEFFEIQAVEDFAMQVGFYLLVLAVLEGLLQISHTVSSNEPQQLKPLTFSKEHGKAVRLFRTAACGLITDQNLRSKFPPCLSKERRDKDGAPFVSFNFIRS